MYATEATTSAIGLEYRIYSINRPGRLLTFSAPRMGANSRLGAYSNKCFL